MGQDMSKYNLSVRKQEEEQHTFPWNGGYEKKKFAEATPVFSASISVTLTENNDFQISN